MQVASAQPYPNRPIRLIVPYPPGASTNDILGRALAVRLADALGQQELERSLSDDGYKGSAETLKHWQAEYADMKALYTALGLAKP